MIIKRFIFPIIAILFLFCALSSCTQNLLTTIYKKDPATNQKVTTRTNNSTEIEEDYTQELENLRARRLANAIEPKNIVMVMLPLSGAHKNIGHQIINGLKFAMEKKPDNNITLEFVDENLPKTELAIYLNDHMSNKVKAIIGPLLGSNAKLVAEYTGNYNVPIFTLSNDIKLAGYRNLFITGFRADEQVKRILGFALENNKKHIYALLPANEYGKSLNVTVNNLDRYEVSYYQTSGKGLDELVNNMALKLKAKMVEGKRDPFGNTALLIVDYDKKIDKIVGNLRDAGVLGLGVQILGINQFIDFSQFTTFHLKDAYFTSYNIQEKAKFAKAFELKFNSKPTELATNIFDITNFVYDNLQRNGYNVNINEIYDNGFQGVNGVFRFNRQNLIERNIAIQKFTGDRKIEEISSPEFIN
jgi:ABC-type branched-subunit amino acid transport system substrate-binding protein